MIIKKKWLVKGALFLGALFFLVECNRFKKKEKKPSPIFQVFVPLEEDYVLLKKGLLSILQLSFPSPNIVVEEGLSDSYQISGFDEWLTKAGPDLILSLMLKAERIEDVPHLLAFLNSEKAKLPIKAKLANSEGVASEFRGEALFCRMQSRSKDILARQLCKELVAKLCFKELRPLAKRFAAQVPPSCEMTLQIKPLDVETLSPKVFLYTGFPLPLKVAGDYPFTRYAEADEGLLMSLFAPKYLDE